MAGSRSIFRSPVPLSNELRCLVQDQLLDVPCTNTLEDLRATIETLSTLTSTFKSVLEDTNTGQQEPDLRTVTTEIRNVLTWTKFLDVVETAPSDPDFLFRAHTHVGPGPPTFVPDLNVPFDLVFRRTLSVDDFATTLAEHLNKIQIAESGERVETCFVSMSPILEWSIHTLGQRWRKRGPGETVGLAIFNAKKLRQDTASAIFRVRDVLRFLEDEGKATLIKPTLQDWARNCDEYVSIGKIPDDGLVRWILWEELSQSPANILSREFEQAYTLGVYRKWLWDHLRPVKFEDICQRIVGFGQVLAGPRDDLLSPLIELVLSPGIQFWGFIVECPEDIIVARIRSLAAGNALLDRIEMVQNDLVGLGI